VPPTPDPPPTPLLHPHTFQVVAAFVTFNCRASWQRCVHDYYGSDAGLWRYLMQATPLRFLGKHRLEVVPAPEPSDILWENVEITKGDRRRRMLVVNVLVALLLAVSTAACVVTGGQEAVFSSGTPSEDLCASHVPLALLRNPTFPHDVTITRVRDDDSGYSSNSTDNSSAGNSSTDNSSAGNSSTDNSSVGNSSVGSGSSTRCPYGASRFTLVSPSGGLPPDWAPTQGPPDPARDPTPCDPTQCISVHTSQLCRVDPGPQGPELRVPLSAVARCFCMARLRGTESPLGVAVMEVAQGQQSDLCRPFFVAFAVSQVLGQLPGVVVTIINLCVGLVLRSLTGFERHMSNTGRMHTLTVKTFVAQFINTALVILVVKVKLPTQHMPGVVRAALTGDKSMLGLDWYREVGGSIVTAMTTGIILDLVRPGSQQGT
jgi:hypothetical protein